MMKAKAVKESIDEQVWTCLGVTTFLGEKDGAQLVECDDGSRVSITGYGRWTDAVRGDRVELWKRVGPGRSWTQLLIQPSREPARVLPVPKDLRPPMVIPDHVAVKSAARPFSPKELMKIPQEVGEETPTKPYRKVRRKKR